MFWYCMPDCDESIVSVTSGCVNILSSLKIRGVNDVKNNTFDGVCNWLVFLF